MSGTESLIIAAGAIISLTALVIGARLRYRPQHRVRLRPEPARKVVAEVMAATVPVKAVSGAPPWDGLPDWAAPEAYRDSGYGYVSGSMGAGDGGGWREQIEADLSPPAAGPEPDYFWPSVPVPPSDLGPRASAIVEQYEQRRRERASGLYWARAQWAAAA